MIPGAAGVASEGMRVDQLVAFTCAAPTHGDGEGGPDKLTVHDGKWAYCPFDARADGHEWKPADGVTLTMLKQMGAPSSVADAKDPAGRA